VPCSDASGGEQRAFDPVPARDAEDLAAASQLRERLFAAIDALPEKLRLIVVLAGIRGHDTREVAALFGLPEGTVKSRLHVARRRLQEQLEGLA
jgi:RNA polymerase sigma-70 factor (ECF subfamily)